MWARVALSCLAALVIVPAGTSVAKPSKRVSVVQAQKAVKTQMHRENSSLLGGLVKCHRLTTRRFQCTWRAQNVLGESFCSGTARAAKLTYGWDVDVVNQSTNEWCYQ